MKDLNDVEKIRLVHDNSGESPSWYVERVRLQSLSSDVTHSLDVRKWLSATEDPYQLSVEVPIPKPGQELPSGRTSPTRVDVANAFLASGKPEKKQR